MVNRWLLAACLAGGLCQTALADTVPQRVLSMNLCTDQLAMMIAAPGQLISVSELAADPRSSAMAHEATDIPVNHGLAEEIFAMKPDLVLVSTFSSPSTIHLLQRLGVRVEAFTPEGAVDDIRENMLRMGHILGQSEKAGALVAQFDTDLAKLRSAPSSPLRAAIYTANSYSLGRDSLSGEIVDLAGFDNIATEFGITAGGTVALEQLILANPELIVEGSRYAGASRSEEILDHPGLTAMKEQGAAGLVFNHDWVCGTPYVLRPVSRLRRIRHELQQHSHQ